MRLRYRIITFPKRFVRGLKSFWYWRKVIYDNAWWDYDYLLELIEHQLKLMINEKNKSWSVEWAQCVDQMNESLRFLEAFRNADDYYQQNEFFEEFINSMHALRFWWD